MQIFIFIEKFHILRQFLSKIPLKVFADPYNGFHQRFIFSLDQQRIETEAQYIYKNAGMMKHGDNIIQGRQLVAILFAIFTYFGQRGIEDVLLDRAVENERTLGDKPDIVRSRLF